MWRDLENYPGYRSVTRHSNTMHNSRLCHGPEGKQAEGKEGFLLSCFVFCYEGLQKQAERGIGI